MLARICAAVISIAVLPLICSADIIVRNNERIAFLGDSITRYGDVFSGGYVNLVMAGLEANGVKAVKIPVGISGNRSTHMLARVDKHVIAAKPQFMTLSCGVNDVWHGKNGVPLPEYKKNITALVEKVQAAGIKVIILTATMIGEDPRSAANVKLAAYNDFLRKLAMEKSCLLADVSADMHSGIAAFKAKYPDFKGNFYTCDGVHMNPCGDAMMAENILRVLGLDEAQIAKAKSAWKKLQSNVGSVTLSAEDTARIAVLAAAEKITIQGYISKLLREQFRQSR